MPHNPRHGADPRVIIGGGSGFSAPPSPPKPNNPMDFLVVCIHHPDQALWIWVHLALQKKQIKTLIEF